MGFDPISAGLAAAGGIYNAVDGAIQKGKGQKLLASTVRPTYYRPSEATGALNLAQNQFNNTQLPGQEQIQNNIGASTSQGLSAAQRAASSSGDVLDSITKLYQGQQNQMGQLGIQAAQQHQQNAQNLQGELNNNAQYSDREFDYNQNQPYQDKRAQALSMIGAGDQNLHNGINSIAGVASAGAAQANADSSDSATSSGEPGAMNYLQQLRYRKKGDIAPMNSITPTSV